MNILSSKPDQNKSSSLAPKAFPLADLSAFSLSSSFTQSNQRRPVFPLSEELKFMNTQISMPDLFQYNDRNKLVLSSDQQEDNVQRYQDKQKKKSLKEIEKNKLASNNCSKQEVKIDVPMKINELDKSLGNLLEKSSIREKYRNQLSKSSSFKEKSEQGNGVESFIQNKKIIAQKVKLPEMKQQIQPSAKKNTQIKIESNISSIVIAPKQVNKQKIQIGSIIPKPKAPVQNIKSNKFFEQIHQEIVKDEIHNPIKPINIQIQNVDISRIEKDFGTNTDHILERIQSQKNPVLIKQQTAKQVQNNNKSFLNQIFNESVTPSRRKRNKIFDQSSKKKQYSHKAVTERERTPQKGVQTEYQKTIKRQLNSKNYDLSPQLKALSILDKLVNQIGNEKLVSKFQEGDLQSQEQKQAFVKKQLCQFNKKCLDAIIQLQNINNIEEMSKNPFIQRIQTLKSKIQGWRDKVSQMQHLIFYLEEIILKFNKLFDIFKRIEDVYRKYNQTSLRLASIQNKLEDYVIIVRNQDSKRLYILRNELKIEIDTLNQLQKCYENTKLQRMFSAYLCHQLSLLSQITHIIDINFENQFPKLAF